ncbi:MAG: hypothetical protein LBL81_05645, partial [Tannerella sp.]|nr:hypothetical protein [Tannerella sp.]
MKKKIYGLLAALFLCCTAVLPVGAQINRTINTIVADVLAQMPTHDKADFNKQMGDLASTGEEGVLMLVQMRHAPGQGSNAAVDDALSGLTAYVSVPGRENLRTATVTAFQKALTQTSDPQTVQFLQSQLRLLGAGPKDADLEPFPAVKADKNAPAYLRIAALRQKLAGLAPKKALGEVEKALKDPSAEYRMAALNFASGFVDSTAYVELGKTLRKAKPEVKAELLNWFGREAKEPQKHPIIASLMLRFDQSFLGMVNEQLKVSQPEVRKEAAWLLVKVGDKGSIPVLAGLLKSQDTSYVSLGEAALASFP